METSDIKLDFMQPDSESLPVFQKCSSNSLGRGVAARIVTRRCACRRQQ